ncbi:MAG: T9SS type A sorting domain-containing protein [Candidatus Poribacteria bacterium]|nr:T9SS type A sorting domain-containing protein [Candidatus Poribacteria bacterium]
MVTGLIAPGQLIFGIHVTKDEERAYPAWDVNTDGITNVLDLIAENDGSLAFRHGIENLRRLLALMLPEETALLPNYPNPFNPETWIPYRLSEPVDVTGHIYATNGVLVRTLALGHQVAGLYESRSRAAYWDGKNEVGEVVASGVYFYTLTAGNFTETRKMLIQK